VLKIRPGDRIDHFFGGSVAVLEGLCAEHILALLSSDASMIEAPAYSRLAK
jgi:hypothetical protein